MVCISIRLYALLVRTAGLVHLHGHKSSVLRTVGVRGRFLKMDTSVFVVARLDMNGLKAAKAMGIEWAQGVPCRLAGLLLVPDAPGKPPRDLFRAREIAGGAFPASICLPWVETWRVNPGVPNRTVQRGINEVKQLLEGQFQ